MTSSRVPYVFPSHGRSDGLFNAADTEYWIQKEREIAKLVVNLEHSGFIVHSRSYELGWTDDQKLYGRIDAVKALVRAKEALPDGLQIKVHYQFLENPNEQELTARENRKIMIDAMCSANFSPYMEEFWHWNYLRDVERIRWMWGWLLAGGG